MSQARPATGHCGRNPALKTGLHVDRPRPGARQSLGLGAACLVLHGRQARAAKKLGATGAEEGAQDHGAAAPVQRYQSHRPEKGGRTGCVRFRGVMETRASPTPQPPQLQSKLRISQTRFLSQEERPFTNYSETIYISLHYLPTHLFLNRCWRHKSIT